MAVQIEILSLTPDSARLALYYVAVNSIAGANDQSRTPAGTSLLRPANAAQLQALKDGTLIELVKSISLSGMSKPEAKTRIESAWAEREAEAQRGYQAEFRDANLIGKAYDGTSWS